MAYLGHETILKRGDGATSEAFTEVAAIKEIQPPQMTRDSVETTVHNTDDRYRTFIPGLRNAGEVTMTIEYDPNADGHTSLLDDFNDDVTHNYEIDFPSSIGETWSFTGFPTALGEATPIGDVVTRQVTFKVTGKPALAATA